MANRAVRLEQIFSGLQLLWRHILHCLHSSPLCREHRQILCNCQGKIRHWWPHGRGAHLQYYSNLIVTRWSQSRYKVMSNLSPSSLSLLILPAFQGYSPVMFLAVHESSIGDLVTQSLSHSLTHSVPHSHTHWRFDNTMTTMTTMTTITKIIAMTKITTMTTERAIKIKI